MSRKIIKSLCWWQCWPLLSAQEPFPRGSCGANPNVRLAAALRVAFSRLAALLGGAPSLVTAFYRMTGAPSDFVRGLSPDWADHPRRQENSPTL